MQLRVFVKADISLQVEGVSQDIVRREVNLSTFGVMGLHWAPLNAEKHLGLKVIVTLNFPPPEKASWKCKASIVREQAAHTDHMGLKLLMDDDRRAALSERIARLGHAPQHYSRAYPRIPSRESLRSFPLEAQVESTAHPERAPMALPVLDLSPGGIRLGTDRSDAQKIHVGEQLRIKFQRSTGSPVVAYGQVCRLMDEVDSESGALLRQLGIRWVMMDDASRKEFLELLKALIAEVAPGSTR
jgi:hypothetical protein